MTDEKRKSRKRGPRAADRKTEHETPDEAVRGLRRSSGRTWDLDLHITAPAVPREADASHHRELTEPFEALIMCPAEGGGNVGVEVMIEELRARVLVPEKDLARLRESLGLDVGRRPAGKRSPKAESAALKPERVQARAGEGRRPKPARGRDGGASRRGGRR